MRRLVATAALLAAAASLGACHNPKAAKGDSSSTPVGTAQIASNDAPNCKPVACTPAGGVGGGSSGSHHGGGGGSASGAAGGGSSSGAASASSGGGHAAAWHGSQHVHQASARRHWWNWGWGGHAWRASAARHPAPRPAQAQWRQARAGSQGWTRQDEWSGRDRELNLAQLHGGWTRRDHYASGYGPGQRWRDDRAASGGRQAHYGYLDEPLDRGAYDERYTRQHSMQASGYANSSTYTRYYGEHRVVAPARVCAPGAWLSPDGRCVWAQRRVGQEVNIPGSFFYDNGGVGADVSGGGGGGGGGFIYGGGSGRASASAFASAHAYASAHASVHVRGGSHGGHGGHGGGCGCGGKH